MIDTVRIRFYRFLRRILTRPRVDLPLACALFLLCCVGLVTLYSAGDGNLSLVGGQAARFVFGGALILLMSRVPPSVFRNWTPWLYAGSTVLLVVEIGRAHV